MKWGASDISAGEIRPCAASDGRSNGARTLHDGTSTATPHPVRPDQARPYWPARQRIRATGPVRTRPGGPARGRSNDVVVIAVIVVLALLWLMTGVRVVQQYERGVVF